MCLPLSATSQLPAVATDVIKTFSGPLRRALAALGVMVSTFGALNSNLLCGPRIYFAMARDRLFPSSHPPVHSRFQTPANAILAQSGLVAHLQIAASRFAR